MLTKVLSWLFRIIWIRWRKSSQHGELPSTKGQKALAPREAGWTKTICATVMMDESVNYTALRVEVSGNGIEKTAICVLVFSPCRIRYEVCQLDKT